MNLVLPSLLRPTPFISGGLSIVPLPTNRVRLSESSRAVRGTLRFSTGSQEGALWLGRIGIWWVHGIDLLPAQSPAAPRDT